MPPSSGRRLIAAGTIGNVREWYDFSIYGFFAAAIGRVGGNPDIQRATPVGPSGRRRPMIACT
jgi:hypothetical protein